MSAVKRNVVWLLLSQGATWMVSAVLLIMVPREVGDTVFGRFSFAFAYVAFFEVLGVFGSGTFLTKTIARDHDSVGHWLSSTLWLKLVKAAALAALAVGIAFIIGFDRETTALIAVFCIGMTINLVNNTFVNVLAGLQRMGRPAMWEVVRLYTGGLLGLTVLLITGNVVAYALVINLSGLISLVGNGRSLRAALQGPRHVSLTVCKQVLFGGFPFFIISALIVIYGSIDIPMLKALTDSETVGWYALAYRWASIPAFFAAAVSTAFFPALSSEGVTVTSAFTTMANRALHFVLLVSVPMAIGIALIADDFVTLLYGGEFSQSVPLIRLLALQVPIVAMDIVLGTVIIAADGQRQWVIFSVMAACFNILTNLAAIPLADHWFDNGAIGAAFTTVLTELILMVGAIFLRPAGVLDRRTTNVTLRVVGAGLLMIPGGVLLSSAQLIVQVTAGVVIFATASLALRAVSPSEVRGLATDLLVRRRSPVTAAAVPVNTAVRSSSTKR